MAFRLFTLWRLAGVAAVDRATAWSVQRMRVAREDPDRGDILQTVVIIGLFVAAAIVIVAIIVGKAKSAASSIKTQ